jgi:eukaryotic-like serine/threonine-protein kinase
MTDDKDLVTRLQRALGDRYTIEREIGGGGMSRLFLAREPSLGREVVIKLLPPELASDVSAARFQREIELAARFQHPNIVPVLAGGASEGLLFYVMPFVRGESLRRLLDSRQQIPIGRALAIIDEVADALSYAHNEGVVHRDIKPENILLAAGHAEVTDFGVARAVEAARSSDHLTGTGISVGSPGYMSPEQLAGERTLDARTDQYALGIVAYELLAGASPFQSPTLQGLVGAHLTQTAPPLATRRPDAPAHVSAAIARALAKDPNERFPDVAAFRAALREGVAPLASSTPQRSRTRWLAVAAVVLAILAATLISYVQRGGGDELDPNLIAVAPFTVFDPSLALWREGMVDVLARKLDGAGPLRAVPPSLAVRRFEGRADQNSAEALGRATGAGLAVYGSLFAQGRDSARLEATLYDVANKRRISDVAFVDATSQLARLTDSATVLLLKGLGRGVPRLSSLTTTSLSALKEYLQGEQFYRRSAWDSAAAHYERSVSLDTAFVLSLYRLTSVYGWRGTLTDPGVIERAELAARRAHGLSLHDSLLISANAIESEAVANGGTSTQIGLRWQAGQLLEEALRKYPGSQDAAMAYADYLYHFAHLIYRGGARDVRGMFDHVIELDSNFTPAYSHPVTLSLALGDTAAAHHYLDAYLARNPTDDDASAARGLAHVLSADKPAASFASYVDTASLNQLTEMHFLTAAWPDADESDVRLSRQVLMLRRRKDSRAEEPPVESRILALSLSFRGHLREAAALLPNALRDKSPSGIMSSRALALELALLGALTPADADSIFRRIAGEPIRGQTGHTGIPYFAARGDTASLRTLLVRLDSLRRVPAGRELATALSAGARGYLALARGDSATALRELDAFPDSVFACSGCYVWQLTRAQLMERAGRWQEARLVLRREPLYWATALGVLWKLERARVAEHLGDIAAARDDYALVVAAWRNPDAQLRVYVDEARRALTRLSPDAPRTTRP